uniref:Protein kinase domain-containing protein n=1 Tax=Parascaris univalens TaxID=6257 RepID=A0A915C3L2_PARUN
MTAVDRTVLHFDIHILVESRPLILKLEELGIDLEKDDIETLKYSIRLDMIVTYKQMLRFAIEICAGMEYLSGCGFIHRDLAARNIFVTADDCLKIGDFGLCRAIDSDENYYKWSFGVVLFELVTLGGTPYSNIHPCDLLKYLKEGQRLNKPQNCGDKLYAIMLHCWQDKPADRPTFAEIQEKLNDLYELPGRDNTSQYYLKFHRTVEYYNLIEEGSSEDVDVSNEKSFSAITCKTFINNKRDILHDKDTVDRQVSNGDLCQRDMLAEENECFISVKYLSDSTEDPFS